MKYVRRFILFIILAMMAIGVLSAEEPCSGDLSALAGKIDACLSESNPRNITEYMCTKGDFDSESSLPITRERTAQFVIISVKFTEIDKKIEAEMKKFQAKRGEDALSYTDAMDSLRPLTNQYYQVCQPVGISLSTMECWADTHNIPLSMDQFPTTFCNTLADKKMIAWSNMAKILAAKSIAKTYQNSKDVHIEKVTGKYAKLLEKWSSYQRIIADTVIGFTAYITDPL